SSSTSISARATRSACKRRQRCSRCATTTSCTCCRRTRPKSFVRRWRKRSGVAPSRRSRSKTDAARVRDVVVVGASLAGFRAVEELRHQGYDGHLTVIGAEPHLPYDRPPLSKQILAGSWDTDRLPLTAIGKELEELDVDWRR